MSLQEDREPGRESVAAIETDGEVGSELQGYDTVGSCGEGQDQIQMKEQVHSWMTSLTR